MSGTPWRTRFAPSPTGAMHLGNARTAILNWLIAQQSQGTFCVRLEDTDQERSSFASEASILSALNWMGLAPQEPVRRQSTRLERYKDTAFKLWENGLAYPCFCTEAELQKDREMAAAKGMPPRYSRRCADLSAEEAREKINAGLPFTLRFKVPDTSETIHFKDLLKGDMDIPIQAFGDFVILRSTGWPSYNLAVVVDDLAMHINLVVRGEDHLTNTARQILLYRALNATPPHFAHHGLLVDREHKKLSKRAGAKSLPQLMAEGIHPLAMVHYLAGLSGAIKGKGIVRSMDDLVSRFNPMRLGRGNAVFLDEDLENLNAAYWHKLPAQDLLPHIQGLESLGRPWQEIPDQHKEDMITVVQQNAAGAHAFVSLLAPLLTDKVTYSLEAVKALALPETQKVIAIFCQILSAITGDREQPLPSQEVNNLLTQVGSSAGVKGKGLYFPLRMALMGSSEGPEIKGLFKVLSLSNIQTRLTRALEFAPKTPDGP